MLKLIIVSVSNKYNLIHNKKKILKQTFLENNYRINNNCMAFYLRRIT